jgi:hypothetical protein
MNLYTISQENILKKILIGAAVILSGCVVEPARVYVQAPPPAYAPAPTPVDYYEAPAPQPVVSVYLEPPIDQPPPILVGWAPPPMLVETPSPLPYDGAIWTGGYWVWEGNWVWAHGRWAAPPRAGYGWVNPYYENRGGSVVFVNGFWGRPGVAFVAPSISVNIQVGIVAAGVIAGPRPIGPEGVFVPAPPGSHAGLIVPAPIGTAPAVVTSAPPIIHGGMHITVNNSGHNVTNVTNITNVTVVAPASATANGQAVNTSVPAQPHLAAALPPVVKAYAPVPASAKPIPAYVAGRQPMNLPPPQTVHAEVNPALMHQHDQVHAAPPAAPVHPATAPAPVPQSTPAPAKFNQENENRQKQNAGQPVNNPQQAPVAKPAPAAPAPSVKQAPVAKPAAPAPKAVPNKPAENQRKEEGKAEKHERE